MKVKTIVKKLKNGDSQALEHIYRLFYKPTFQTAFFITNDASLAEDAIHEVFLKLQNKIDQLEDPSKLEAWLCRMAVNTAWDIIRNRSRNKLFAEAGGIYTNNPSSSPEAVMLNNEEKEIIKQQIKRLQPKYKRVIYLKYYKEMSVGEISTALGIPLGTVKSRLIRARKELKKLLDPKDRLNRHNIRLIDSKEVK